MSPAAKKSTPPKKTATKPAKSPQKPAQRTATVLVSGTQDDGNVRWLTGFSAPDPFLVALAPNGRPHLFVSALEARRATQAAKPGATVHVYRRNALDALLDWAKDEKIAAFAAGPAVPYGLVRDLQQGGFPVDLPANPRAAFRGRETKTDTEIRCIALAQAAAAAAIRRARAILREATVAPDRARTLRWQGKVLTSERLRDAMEAVIRAHACASDDGLIAAGGRQAACPHESGHGPLRAGETIVLDVFPRHQPSGYWGDMTRTLMKGPPKNPQILAMYRAVLEAQRIAFRMVRPGESGANVHLAVQAYFVAAGFPLDTSRPGHERGMFHGLGHGVGLDIHEEPRLSPSSSGRLRAGNVVTVEPGLYDPAIGGIRIEDTIVVRSTAPQFLSVPPRSLLIP